MDTTIGRGLMGRLTECMRCILAIFLVLALGPSILLGAWLFTR